MGWTTRRVISARPYAVGDLPSSEWEALRAALEPYCWPTDRMPGEGDPVLCFFHHQVGPAGCWGPAAS
jgi:hypothetical protein